MQNLSNVELTLAALLVEAVAGYPAWVYRVIGHPVTWIGALIAALDRRFNTDLARDGSRRALGTLALIAVMGIAGGMAFAFQFAWPPGLLGIALQILAATSLLAQRSLEQHVRAVADALESGGLDEGRSAVSMIVGRDTGALDEFGVARAAIESLAENFSDGVIAPAFWMAIAGLPGAAVYKAVNTADSMIGHRSRRYAAFGWAAARFDDLINLPASRMTALFIVAGALITRTSARGAARAVWRDASRHRSPNAGWPEAAMAGALGMKLAGPRVYAGVQVDDAYMGNGRPDATAADIQRALRLFRAARTVPWLLLLAIVVISRG